jgi:hypothetical protein
MDFFSSLKKKKIKLVENKSLSTYFHKIHFNINNNIYHYIGYNSDNIDYSSVYLLKKNKTKIRLNSLLLNSQVKTIYCINKYIIIDYYMDIIESPSNDDDAHGNDDVGAKGGVDINNESCFNKDKDDFNNTNKDTHLDFTDKIEIYEKNTNIITNYIFNIIDTINNNSILSNLLGYKNNDFYNVLFCKKRYKYYYEAPKE